MNLRHFNNVDEVLSYVMSELIGTLQDQLDHARAEDYSPSDLQILDDELHDVQAVDSLVRNAAGVPTEAMIDAARQIILGIFDAHPRNIEAVRAHVLRCGGTLEHWPHWAKVETGHLTKGGIADLIYSVMAAAR